MFERFTHEARAVLVVAQEEARLMRHAHIGTEHLLVALARGRDDVAAPILHEVGLSGVRARAEAVSAGGVGDHVSTGQLPFTPAAKDALDATLHEAMALGHERIEPSHLLLAVLRQRDGVAGRIVLAAGAAPPDVRAQVIARLEARVPATPPAPAMTLVDDGVPVSVGDALVGDLGHPQTDGRVLLAILERRGAVAAWLREHGVDEDAVRRMLGER